MLAVDVYETRSIIYIKMYVCNILILMEKYPCNQWIVDTYTVYNVVSRLLALQASLDLTL